MDLQTLNEDEFATLHPSVKKYLSAGVDTNVHGEKLVSEKNFFNMDLLNSDPYDLDPDLSKRTEKFRDNPNYFFEGIKTGGSHALELFAAIPGGMDRFYDWGKKTLGFQPTDDSIFDYAEQYLKDIAHDIGPEYKDFTKPEGFMDNFWYGLGQALPTILSYHPFVRGVTMAGKGLQAVQGAGKIASGLRGTGRFLQVGGGLPAGIATADMTREIDDAKTFDIIKAGAYGYGTGKILNIANKLNILPRVAGLGSFGYLTSGWQADNDQRLAAAAVWGVLGVFGPMAEGKPIRRQLSDVEMQTKMLMGKIEKPQLAQNKVSELKVEIENLRKEGGVELKPGNEVVINERGDKAEIIAFNKKNIKKGVSNDYYVLKDKNNPDSKKFIMTPELIKSRNVIKDKNKIEKLEKELVKFEDLAAKAKEEPVRNLAAEKMAQNDQVIQQHKTLIRESEAASKFQKANEEAILRGEEPKPIPENLIDKVMSGEQIAKHEKYVNDLITENIAFGKIVWTNQNYNQAIFGKDTRPTEVFKQDMYNTDGSKKYVDMKESFTPDLIKLNNPAETYGTFGKGSVAPPKFIDQPGVKYTNDSIYTAMTKRDVMVEQMLYDPMFSMDKVIGPGKKPGDKDYLLKLNSPTEYIRLAGMRKVRTEGGALTGWEIISAKNPKKAVGILDAAERVYNDKLAEARKNKESYTTRVDQKTGESKFSKKELTEADIKRIDELRFTRTKDNKEAIDAEIANIIGFDPFLPAKEAYFKYQVTNKELTSKYKLDAEQIKIYRNLEGLFERVVDRHNKSAIENKGDGYTIIEKIPNYFPRIFEGDFAAFLMKWNSKRKVYQPVEAPGANNKFSIEERAKKLAEEWDAPIFKANDKFNNKQKLSSEYVVKVVKRDRSQLGSEELTSFDRLFTKYNLDSESFIQYQAAVDKMRKSVGFKRFSLQRKGVDGYLGSESNARAALGTKFLGSKIGDRNVDLKRIADFTKAATDYTKGGITSAMRIDFTKKFGDIWNKPISISNAKGGLSKTTLRKDYPVAAKFAEELRGNAFGELRPAPLVEKLSQLGSDYIGNAGLTRILGGANQVTLNAKLLFGNMRFLLSQVFQPYHMIFPKLVNLQYSGFDKGKVAMAQIKSFRDLFFPNKEMKSVIEYMYREGVVDQKFLNEASANIKGLLPKEKLPFKDPLGRQVFDFSKLLRILTLQDFAGKAEQVSRLNASLMFYNFFRSAGKDKQISMEMAAYNANKYMVEYNYLEQPGIYGNRGLGPLGKPFGLFKTFQHNYLAQLAEYSTQAAQGKGSAGLLAFMTQMVFAAGVFGVIGYESAERVLRILSPTMQKFTGKPLPSLTETILTSTLPNTFKYGVPSSTLNVDLTATLAAPGVNVGDLISAPALDYLGLNPLNGFASGKGRGIIPTGFNALVTAIASDSPVEKKENNVKFLLATAPTSMQGFIEQYYEGLPLEYWKYWSPGKEFKEVHNTSKYTNLQGDPFKRGRGTVVRGYDEWFARTFSSVSLAEKEALKLVYVTTRLKKNLRDDISGYLTAGAKHLMTDGYVPLYIQKKLTDYGLTYNQIFERLTNRADLMNTTILDRLLKKTNAMQNNRRIGALRDMAISHGFDSAYKY